MIVGKGNISSAIIDRDDVVFFASGVSDSSETNEAAFTREHDLLFKQDWNKHLVYFSSLSIYHSNRPYDLHKKKMEELVRRCFKSYTIFRIEVIAWGKNKTTIHNVFRRKIANGEIVDIQNTFRYVLYKEEFQYWLSLIPVGEKHEMNVPGLPYSIQQIYDFVKEGKL